MKRWLILLTVGALASCAANPPNPWQSVETCEGAAQQPLDLVRFPVPHVTGEDTATYTLGQIQQLDAFKTASEANTSIARQHAATIDQQCRAIDGLVRAGQAQRTVADMRAEMLQEERQARMFERFGYWAIIAALGVAAVD